MANRSSEHMTLPRRYQKMISLMEPEAGRVFKRAMIDAHKKYRETLNKRNKEDYLVETEEKTTEEPTT